MVKTLTILTMLLSISLTVLVVYLSIQNKQLKNEVTMLKHFTDNDIIKTIELDKDGAKIIILKKMGEDNYTHVYYTIPTKPLSILVDKYNEGDITK
jgi:hypothetical protein